MDAFDQLQEEEMNISKRIISEQTSLEIAQKAFKADTRTLNGDTATDEQVRDEMLYSMMNCSPCKRKDEL